MKCPFCNHMNDKVVDSREGREGESIRRRRECLKCEKRYTTYERIDEIPYMVIKKDGRREKFERQKVLSGLLRACEKRAISMAKMEQIVNDAEKYVVESTDHERLSADLGKLIMSKLKALIWSPISVTPAFIAISKTSTNSALNSITCSAAKKASAVK